jgi:hypothetical protein
LVIELKWVPSLPVSGSDIYHFTYHHQPAFNSITVDYPLHKSTMIGACREAWYQNMWYIYVAGNLPRCHSQYGIAQVNHFFARMVRLENGTLLCEVNIGTKSMDEILQELRSTSVWDGEWPCTLDVDAEVQEHSKAMSRTVKEFVRSSPSRLSIQLKNLINIPTRSSNRQQLQTSKSSLARCRKR